MKTEEKKKRGQNDRNAMTTHPMKNERQKKAKERQDAYTKLTAREKVQRAGKKQLEKFAECNHPKLRRLARERLGR